MVEKSIDTVWNRFLVSLVVASFLPIALAYWRPAMGGIRNTQMLVIVVFTSIALISRYSFSQLLSIQISRKTWLALWGFTTLAFLVTTSLHVWGLRINGEDFSIFDWMLYNTTHREFMTTPICNMNDPLGVCHHFGVHQHYHLVYLSILHWLFLSPFFTQTLHALAISAGLWPLWLLCRKVELRPVLTFFVLFAYSFNSFTGSLLNHGFYPEGFYLPIGLWFAWGWGEGRWQRWLPAFIAFIAIKEDAAVYMSIFAIGNMLFTDRKRWRELLLILGVSVCLLVMNLYVVQPYFLAKFGRVKPAYMNFWRNYGGSFKEIIWFAFSHPVRVMVDVLTTRWYMFFGLLLMIPLCSRRPLWVLLAIAGMFGISSNPHLRGYATYYPAPLLPFTMWGLLEGWQQLQRWSPTQRWAQQLLLAACLLFGLVGGGYQKFPVVQWQALQDLADIREELGAQPAAVCAQTVFFPRLPYDWNMKPLAHECMDLPGAVGIVGFDKKYDPYPYTAERLQSWIGESDIIREYPSGIYLLRKRVAP